MIPDPAPPTASVVIPAHDEESVVLRCLTALLAEAHPGEFEVVVAANGCSDGTVAAASTAGPDVRCLDLLVPGKIGALNAADTASGTFPRIYLDADVVLTTRTARDLVATLRDDGPLVAAPRMRVDTSRSSWAVRAYYRVWTRLPVFGDGYVGSGVYAVNAAGHGRIAPFPGVTNDDDYVRRSFAPDERRTSPGEFLVHPARTTAALVRRGERTRAGNTALAERRRTGPPDVAVRDAPRSGGMAAVLARTAADPRRWPDLAVFVLVTARIRVGAARRLRRGAVAWGRDDSSRVVEGTGS